MTSPAENGTTVEMAKMNTSDFRNEEDYSSDDSRMPLRGSRNGNWWYALYHNVTAIVGSGVLALPTAMVYLGWAGGTVILVMSWIITLFTIWQMVEMYEMEDKNGETKISRTYYELGQRAFGEKLGLWIVVPVQLCVFVGLDIVYMVAGGQSLWLVYQYLYCSEERHVNAAAIRVQGQCCGIGQTAFTVFFALPQFLLAQLDGFNSIAFISFFASVMSVCCCTIAWVESWREGIDNHSEDSSLQTMNCSTDYKFPASKHIDDVFGVFSALGVVAFAYGGHNMVLEIQQTLPSSKENPSKIHMWHAVVVAYVIVALCYFPVAFVGYWAFGSHLANLGSTKGNPSHGNLLLQFYGGENLIVAANIMLVVHVTGGYLLYAMPAFEAIEMLEKKFQFIDVLEDIMEKFNFRQPTPYGSKSVMRVVTRSTYVFLTTFLACTFPFFDDLLASIGGIALTPTTYFLPCIIFLRLRKPKSFTVQWLMNWFCIIIGVLITIVAIIGGMYNLVEDVHKHTGSYYQFNCENSTNNATNCRKLYFDK